MNFPKKEILDLAMKAYKNAKAKGYITKPIIMIVDFTMPSTQKRLWIMDVSLNKIIYVMEVTHGTNSGGLYATKFSNHHGSHQSSLGVYKTLKTYISNKLGYALRLNGLEPGVNNNALARAILVHGADYIGNGKQGRSWGCFAVPRAQNRRVIDVVKEGAMIFAYYPDQRWLKTSSFLK